MLIAHIRILWSAFLQARTASVVKEYRLRLLAVGAAVCSLLATRAAVSTATGQCIAETRLYSLFLIMGNPIYDPNSEQDEQSSRDYCRHDRSSRRRLDLARNPFRIPQNLSPSDRRRAQVTRTSYRGDTFTVRGEFCSICLFILHGQPGCIADYFRHQDLCQVCYACHASEASQTCAVHIRQSW